MAIRSLVVLNFEADEDWDSCCALHRLAAIRDYSENFVRLVGRKVDALRHFFVVLNQLLSNDCFLLIFGLTWLEEARDRSNFLEKSRLRLEKRLLTLSHVITLK
jgi:hypothetical protein